MLKLLFRNEKVMFGVVLHGFKEAKRINECTFRIWNRMIKDLTIWRKEKVSLKGIILDCNAVDTVYGCLSMNIFWKKEKVTLRWRILDCNAVNTV